MIRRHQLGRGSVVADYIDRNILCQAYIHVEIDHLNPQQVDDLKRHLKTFVESRGRFFLYEDVSTDVEFKEGSLKIYGTVVGALYIAISQYGSFRSGVDYLATDTKRLAECIASESLFLTKSRHDKTIRVEARVGIAGSLKNAVDKLDRIRGELADVSLNQTNRRIAELESDIGKLMDNLNDPSDPPYVAGELCTLITQWLPLHPPPPSDPKKPKPTKEVIAAYQRARSELAESVKKAGKKPRKTD
jgi:hypothetical protein